MEQNGIIKFPCELTRYNYSFTKHVVLPTSRPLLHGECLQLLGLHQLSNSLPLFISKHYAAIPTFTTILSQLLRTHSCVFIQPKYNPTTYPQKPRVTPFPSSFPSIFKTRSSQSSTIANMRPKTHQTPKLKFIILSIFLGFLLLLSLRYRSLPLKQNSSSSHSLKEEVQCSTSCTKIPPSLAQALIHYSTSTITPQQTRKEISVTSAILERRSPCNFLVFGLGHDSLMWSSLNHGGRTVFLEEDSAWIGQIGRRFPTLESYQVTYDSRVNQADELMEAGKGMECVAVGNPKHSMCQLALKGLPSEVYETQWDLIMVDAPTGFHEEAPGRMMAIYTSGMLARNREVGETDVFVHDVNREVEDKFSKAFLCDGYMKRQEGRLRHFTIPSHRDGSDNRAFCPE